MLKKLWPFTKGYRMYALLCAAAMIFEVVMEVRIPLLMARIVDEGIPNRDMGAVISVGLLMVLMALLSLCFGVTASKMAATSAMGFGSRLRGAMFDKIQEFSFSNVDRFSTASLVTRMTTDVQNTQNAFLMALRMLTRAPIMLVLATGMALSINSRLARVFFVAIPIMAVCLFLIARVAFGIFQTMLKKYDRMNGMVQENLIAIRVVKAFVRAGYEKKKYREAVQDVYETSVRAERVVMLMMPLMQLVIYSCIVSVLWFGGNMIIAGSMQTGELISFISYITQILMSLMMLSMVMVNFVISRASLARITEVLDEVPSINDEGASATLQVRDGSVEFRDVTFRYNKESEEPILRHTSFSIQSGETVGILGGTGSAKTTLVQLIPRLYEVEEGDGEVLVGGRNVKEYPIPNLRQGVGMVLQNNVLFSGTIRDNLRWGNDNATDGEIEEACKAAQAHDFIMSFPDGYDTDLGQGGVNVSGGQKQRLCIARALIKRPKILILDDSTSAVDTATDAKIRQSFRESLPETTKIIIAQRVASVMDAEKIIVMDEGAIQAMGTHQELLATNTIYQEVFQSQQKGVAD